MNIGQACVLALCGAALFFNSPPSNAQAADRVEFGTTGRSDATSIVTYIAFEKKLFEAEGLSIDWIAAGSAAKAAQQTVAGSLNISIAATDQTIRAINEGAKLKIVAGSVMAAPFSVIGGKGVTKWSQLKGKTVSVGGASDQTLFFLHVMARKNSVADKDYDLIYAGTTPARFSELLSGAVGAAVLTNPQDIMATKMGYANLGSAPDYVPVWAQNNVYVNEEWAQSHRSDVAAFIRALRKATAFFYNPKNKEDAVAVMMKYTHTDKATAEKIYQFYVEKHIIAPDAALSAPGIEAVDNSLVEIGSLRTPVPAARLIDDSYFKATDP